MGSFLRRVLHLWKKKGYNKEKRSKRGLVPCRANRDIKKETDRVRGA